MRLFVGGCGGFLSFRLGIAVLLRVLCIGGVFFFDVDAMNFFSSLRCSSVNFTEYF